MRTYFSFLSTGLVVYPPDAVRAIAALRTTRAAEQGPPICSRVHHTWLESILLLSLATAADKHMQSARGMP